MKHLRRLLLLTDGLYLLSGGLIGPIYALYVEKIGGDLLDASSTFAFFMITAGFVTYLLAKWEDKQKHQEKFVIVGYGIGVLGYLLYLFVSNSYILFFVQIILGLSVALKDPAYDALFSASRKHLALAWGEWEAVDYLVLGVGALIGGFIAEKFGFQMLLFVMFGFSVFSFLLSMLLLQTRKHGAI
jgi:predicted MFS family arabinose efflux permease